MQELISPLRCTIHEFPAALLYNEALPIYISGSKIQPGRNESWKVAFFQKQKVRGGHLFVSNPPLTIMSSDL